MKEKESLNKEPLERENGSAGKPKQASGRFAAFAQKLFQVVKFLFGLGLLPFVYAFTLSFLGQFSQVDSALRPYFWFGVASFLAIHLLVWEPAAIYNSGHKLVELIFAFFKPLVGFAPYVLPVYTLLAFFLYGLFSVFDKSAWALHYCLFLTGFTVILHLVFSSRTLRSKKDDFLKANYIFGFAFIYLINITLLACGLYLILQEFSFGAFFNSAMSQATGIFRAAFRQVFLI
ncbi:MAG: hypothetical protein FJZ09_06960 [Candidatus Omnitrophica bacterium]|nr:hypothetical protein [Candidatus Omnitrophota bacterium]